ncbi:MAG TPA: hypothetical protein VF754_08255, partial [Pyrinomonadaceae bacterium]
MTTRCKSETPARAVALLRMMLGCALLLACSAVTFADHLRLVDGKTIEVDEAWEDAQGVWYRRGGVTHLVERSRVRAIERRPRAETAQAASETPAVVRQTASVA